MPMITKFFTAMLATAVACVAVNAQTNNIKRPVKKRAATTRVETTTSKPKKAQRSSKPAAKASNKPTQQTKVTYTSSGAVCTIAGVKFEMVRVDGGTFLMGATGDLSDGAWDDETPVHSVSLDTYYIGKTEVTQALWKAVMGSNPSAFKGDNMPVQCVSWYDCQAFISRLNTLTGKRFYLPTEAQWEFACRGGNKSRGYLFSGSNSIGDVAWYFDNGNSRPHPVAAKAPNDLGIYDMTGNLMEWCADWVGDYEAGMQRNPQGPSTGEYRICRGGSWRNNARKSRVSYRSNEIPSNSDNGLGFRLAL